MRYLSKTSTLISIKINIIRPKFNYCSSANSSRSS